MAVANFKDTFSCNAFEVTLAFLRGVFKVSETTPVSFWEKPIDVEQQKNIRIKYLKIKIA
jgi:hypothetical protein